MSARPRRVDADVSSAHVAYDWFAQVRPGRGRRDVHVDPAGVLRVRRGREEVVQRKGVQHGGRRLAAVLRDADPGHQHGRRSVPVGPGRVPGRGGARPPGLPAGGPPVGADHGPGHVRRGGGQRAHRMFHVRRRPRLSVELRPRPANARHSSSVSGRFTVRFLLFTVRRKPACRRCILNYPFPAVPFPHRDFTCVHSVYAFVF